MAERVIKTEKKRLFKKSIYFLNSLNSFGGMREKLWNQQSESKLWFWDSQRHMCICRERKLVDSKNSVKNQVF